MGAATLLSPFAPSLTNTKLGRALLFFWIHRSPTTLAPDRALEDFQAFRRASWTVLRFITEGTPFKSEIDPAIPVTIAWSDWDVVLPRYQARVARNRLPDAEHIRLPHCGHVPMHDAPELVANVILKGSQS
jgi:pimeloyl-ACP methyl ester carboxylesterase